ncbi:formate hydrogenlyase maturation protein HycH [Azospirillum halopraeferens]|uniref:formate hydrogenlyase maturation protein HycH n=1 Tax=Azospirillum halopraeferens TaxID=34010 RepID=UPI00041916B3|nr:formate hydrogenlyase maturation protein HycH [Azospirillum halopraeferens]
MTGQRVVIHQLTQKFLDKADVPAQSEQVMYYALALGHHVGVIDCLSTLLDIPDDAFGRWIEKIPNAEARRKLVGVLRFGEIVIDTTHTRLLRSALAEALPGLEPEEEGWARTLDTAMRQIDAEPAIYLIGRLR